MQTLQALQALQAGTTPAAKLISGVCTGNFTSFKRPVITDDRGPRAIIDGDMKQPDGS